MPPIRDLVHFRPQSLDSAMLLHAVRPGDPLWDRAERFVYSVYRATGFCAESPRQWVEETDPWRADSALHVVTDERGEVAGVARTMLGRYEELPIGRFRSHARRPGLLCEIGSLAVRPDRRGLGVANAVHRAAFQRGIRAGVGGFCFMIDRWLFDYFETQYGLPVRELAPSQSFMGGDVVPTAMWMPEMLAQIAVIRPRVYRWAVKGFSADLRAALKLPPLPRVDLDDGVTHVPSSR
jgi:hypothetical protein